MSNVEDFGLIDKNNEERSNNDNNSYEIESSSIVIQQNKELKVALDVKTKVIHNFADT